MWAGFTASPDSDRSRLGGEMDSRKPISITCPGVCLSLVWSSDKSRVATGSGLIDTLVLCPPQNSTLTVMGFGDLKLRLSSKLGSSSSPVPSPVSIRSPLSPGSSKVDHIYDFDLLSPVTSPGLAQSYYDGHHGPPPPYHPESGSDSNARPTDAKMPTPYNAHTGAIYTPTDATGESPLKVLEKHDIVIVLDDSHSMTFADRRGGRTRWDQVR